MSSETVWFAVSVADPSSFVGLHTGMIRMNLVCNRGLPVDPYLSISVMVPEHILAAEWKYTEEIGRLQLTIIPGEYVYE